MSTASTAGFSDPEAPAWGFGDPLEAQGVEAGFGDPYDVLRVELASGTRTAPHTGGAPVELVGNLEPGAYMIQLTIDGAPVEFYSGIAEQGPTLYPRRGGRLRGYTPPAPAGTYTLKLLYGPGYTQTLTLSEQLTIEPAARLAERYHLARYLPTLYASGPRDYSQHDIDPATETPRREALELIIETSAQLATGTARPSSVAVTDTAAGEGLTIELESLLGFPQSGRVWIGAHPRAIAYTTAPPRSILLHERAPAIPRLTPVEVARDY